MRYSLDPARQPWLRRAVLGLAITVALVIALPWSPAPVALAVAAEKAATPAPDASGKASPATDTPVAPAAKAAPAEKAPKAAPPPATDPDADEPDVTAPPSGNAASEITIDHRGITVQKGGKRVNIHGLGADREYDSFRDFVNDAPWLAALVFLLVLLFFLTPLLILVLVIWYKVRKNRMQNETMLKLAEKGMVAPSEAMESLVRPATPGGIPPSVAPLYEQARQLRKRSAWSDLRKGVVLVAVGLGLVFFSMLDDGTPNSVGLICLFLGIGYFVLWYFEDRHSGSAPGGAGTPPAGGA